MTTRLETIGGLRVRIVDQLDGRRPSLVVVLSHGYGASGSDLVPIGDELLNYSETIGQNVQFVFPEAPLSLDEQGLPGGRAWWHLDLVRLQIAAATGRFRSLRGECPDGLIKARELLRTVVEQWSARQELALDRFILGGFSQGAMISTDVALQLPTNLAGLVVMSGSLVNEAEWRELAPRHAGLRVLQSHGRGDPLLPFTAAEWLNDLLVSSGIEVEFHAFDGQHTIPLEVLQRLAEAIESLVKSSTD